jgi:hypothetical protein
MSLVLAGTADSITYVLDAAPATNQLPASVYYALQGGAGSQANTLSAGTTPVTILAGSGTAAIVVNSLVIPNRDTATRTVTVNMVTGAGTFEQVQVILASGSHLNYSSGNGWYVMDKNGNFLETVTVTGGTSTVNQGTANTLTNAWPVEITDGTNVLGVAAHPVRVDPTGTTTQPISGTVTVNAGTGNLGVNLTQLNSVALGSPSNYGTSPGAVSVQGVNAFVTNTVPVSQSGTWTIQPGNTANTTAWLVTGTGGTFPTTPPANASTNVTQFGGTNVSTGTGASGAGIPRVTVANDSNVLVTQSTSPWVDNISQWGGSATTLGQKVSASSVPVVIASDQSILTIQGAAFAIGANVVNGTTAVAIGLASTTSIRSLSIVSQAAVLAAGTVVLRITDGGGTLRLAFMIPTGTTGEIFSYSDLNVPLVNAGTAATMVLSTNLTSGSFYVNIAYS